MTYATSEAVGLEFAKALGLETRNLASFSIHFRAGQLVACDAEYFVEKEALSPMTEIIGKRYHLTERQ